MNLGEASHRHSYPVGSLEEDVLHVYRKVDFVVVSGVSGRIPLCHEESGEAPK